MNCCGTKIKSLRKDHEVDAKQDEKEKRKDELIIKQKNGKADAR
jgi:hypothetical protein